VKKMVLGLGALFLYASLGISSGLASTPGLTPKPDAVRMSHESGRPTIGAAGKVRPPAAPSEMSEEEKQRRKDVCVTEHDFCYDWCTKSKRKSRDQALCYEDCARKLADCMAKIPD